MPFDDNGAYYEPLPNGARNYILPYGTDKSDAVTYSISKVTAKSSVINDQTFEVIMSTIHREAQRIVDKTVTVKKINLPAAGQGAGETQKVPTATYDSLLGVPNAFPRVAIVPSERYGWPTNSVFTWTYIRTNYPSQVEGDGDVNTSADDTEVTRNDYNILTKFADEVGIDNPGPKARETIRASHINDFIDSIRAAGKQCICNTNYCQCNCNYCTCNCNYNCTCDCNYSDVRLKENIEFLYEKNNLRFYSYNYIWNKKVKEIGVLAQELLKTQYSTAVCKDSNGFYMVNYNKLPL